MGRLQFVKMSGFTDAYNSFETVTWTKINYEEDLHHALLLLAGVSESDCLHFP